MHWGIWIDDYAYQDDDMVRRGNSGVLGSESRGSERGETQGAIMRQTMWG
jgi:hypothetical protein